MISATFPRRTSADTRKPPTQPPTRRELPSSAALWQVTASSELSAMERALLLFCVIAVGLGNAACARPVPVAGATICSHNAIGRKVRMSRLFSTASTKRRGQQGAGRVPQLKQVLRNGHPHCMHANRLLNIPADIGTSAQSVD